MKFKKYLLSPYTLYVVFVLSVWADISTSINGFGIAIQNPLQLTMLLFLLFIVVFNTYAIISLLKTIDVKKKDTDDRKTAKLISQAEAFHSISCTFRELIVLEGDCDSFINDALEKIKKLYLITLIVKTSVLH